MIWFLLVEHMSYSWAISTFCTLFPKSWDSCTLYLCFCSNCGGYPALLVSHRAAPKYPWTVMSMFVFNVKTLKTSISVKTAYWPTGYGFMNKLVHSNMNIQLWFYWKKLEKFSILQPILFLFENALKKQSLI